jgi:hypothetical protein
MASVAFLSIPAMGTAMLLVLRATTIGLTAAIAGLPGLPSLLQIPLLNLCPQLWEYDCRLRIVFLL